jgi:hypothetical protein
MRMLCQYSVAIITAISSVTRVRRLERRVVARATPQITRTVVQKVYQMY